MNNISFDDIFTVALVWGYNCKFHRPHLVTIRDIYEIVDYRHLVHPDDLSGLRKLIKERMREQRRLFEPARFVVSLHRVKDSKGLYHPHLCLISMSRDDNNRLSSLFGIDLRVSEDIPLNAAQQRYISRFLQDASERLGPIFLSLISPVFLQKHKPVVNVDPYTASWRCGNYLIEPSRFEMTKIGDRTTVPLTEKQSLFIALLLGAQNSNGKPVYVERAKTRLVVFGVDPEDPNATDWDNDVDRLVKFFRGYLGRFSITTKRGYGHLLRTKRHICEDDELLRALALS